MARKNKDVIAGEKAQILDAHTQALLTSVAKKNSKALRWFIVCWTILFALAVVSIVDQNHLANQNKAHIDCIVKLLATPSHPGQTRQIADLSTCQIKVSQ